MRVAPRSVISVTAVSAMIASGESAVLATGQVQLMSPTVRKRTDSTSLTSPSCFGVIGVTGTSRPFLRTTSRWCV